MREHPQQYDKEKVHFNVARLKSHGHTFEVVVHPDQAIALKQGAAIDIKDVLYSEKVFFDAQKGLMAGESEMMSVFNSKDPKEVAIEIIKRGEIQLSAEYRDKLRKEKAQKIVYLIHRNAMDPRTQLPHPTQRIQLALDEAKIKVDEFKSAEDQVQEIVKKLQPILPIKFEIIKVEVKIPAQHAPRSFQTLKSYGTVLKESWLNDGSLLAEVEMPAGMQTDFYDAVNKITHGTVQTKVLGSR